MDRVVLSEQIFLENLHDAGLKEETIEKALRYFRKQDDVQQLCLLTKERCRLLEKLHVDQARMSCLDYLIYQVKKLRQEESSDAGANNRMNKKGG